MDEEKTPFERLLWHLIEASNALTEHRCYGDEDLSPVEEGIFDGMAHYLDAMLGTLNRLKDEADSKADQERNETRYDREQ